MIIANILLGLATLVAIYQLVSYSNHLCDENPYRRPDQED